MRDFFRKIGYSIFGKKIHIVLCEKTFKRGEFLYRCYGPGYGIKEYLVTNIKERFGGWEYTFKYLDR